MLTNIAIHIFLVVVLPSPTIDNIMKGGLRDYNHYMNHI